MTTTEESAELGRTVRRFLEQRGSEAVVRALMEDRRGYDPAVWQQLADQLGVQGLSLPERYGGGGYGLAELFPVFEEMGRSLLPSPLFSTAALATPALLASGDAEAMDLFLPGIAAGTTIATLAVAEGEQGWDERELATRAVSGDGWRVSGEKTYVTDAHVSDLILVLAATDDGPAVFAVDAAAVGVDVDVQPTLDLTRWLATVRLDAAPGRLVGALGAGWSIVRRALAAGSVALAAEQVGGAQRVLEMGVAYAKMRVAVGRKIGSFQAVKHKLANVLVLVENARSAALDAARAVSEDAADADLAVSVAKAYCSDVGKRVCEAVVQVHGGMGLTWECRAHVFLKRMLFDRAFLGDEHTHFRRIAELRRTEARRGL